MKVLPGDFKAIGADYVVKGEGEHVFPHLLRTIGLNSRDDAVSAAESENRCLEDCQGYISPFVPEYLRRIRGRIAYIESSRGCPYRCSYCLSSESRGLVFHPLEDVKEDIKSLVGAGARIIKFVDRSFNINEEHSTAIWEFIKQFPKEQVTFHFEINPDRLTNRQMKMLEEMPPGLIQVEAGIQSTNPEALKAVSRVMDVELALKNLKRLTEAGNIHVHADLIAGLPGDDLISFKDSFNRVYETRPHNLQLGFLKLLHGTRMRREASLHNYQYRDYPPYELISNKYIQSGDILMLKGVEELVDRFYNSGRFVFTLDYLVKQHSSAFGFYEMLYEWEKKQDLLFKPVSALNMYQQIKDFASELTCKIDRNIFNCLLCLDYVCALRTTVIPGTLFPEGLEENGFRVLDIRSFADESIIRGLGKTEARKRYIVLDGIWPVKKGEDFEYLRNRIMIDVRQVNPVTGRAEAMMI